MRLQDILSRVPGLEKRFVHYLESQGYIRPAKIQKARIARRDYSPADFERVRAIWRYHQRGISVQRAYELLTRGAAEGAYALIPTAAGRWRDAIDLLAETDQVVETAAVYGESATVIAKLRAPHDSDVHHVLDRLFEARIIEGQPRVFRFGAGAPSFTGRYENARPQEDGMKAWVLIKVPAKQIGGLVDELRSYPGVVEAAAIYGETDVIAKIEVPDQAALDQLVLERIQAIEAVESTRTFIAIGGLQWQRQQTD
jgi:DNA-binding Lrp family transcriptional regulator